MSRAATLLLALTVNVATPLLGQSPPAGPVRPVATGQAIAPDRDSMAREKPSFTGTVLAAAGGGVVGAFTGAFISLRGRGSDAMLVLPLAGMVTGGAVGAAATTERWGPSFAGSLSGTVVTIFTAMAAQKVAGAAGRRIDGIGWPIALSLVHGTVTALIARR